VDVIVILVKTGSTKTFLIINSIMAKKEFPEIKEKNEGKFTAWVEKNMPGKSTCAAASAVIKNKKKYKPAVVKMANYANNFGCKKK
jgi:hypothetical protein